MPCLSLVHFVLVAVAAADAPAGENAVFKELVAKASRCPTARRSNCRRRSWPTGWTPPQQQAAMAKAPRVRGTVKELLGKSYYAPVVVKVRTLKASPDDGPAVRAVDVWFVAHGDWDTLARKVFSNR